MARRLVALILLVMVLLAPTSAFADAAGQLRSDETPQSTEQTDEPTEQPTGDASEEPDDAAPEIPDGPFIRVQLLDQTNATEGEPGEPVPDVTMVVSDDSGEVGEAATDAEGVAIIPIPGSGTYSVELQEDSLPEGTELSDDTDNPVEVRALISGANGALFPIGVQEAETASFGSLFASAMVSGLKFGLITALAALGLSLIFGTTGLTNFSHGELITFGGIMTWVVNVALGLPVVLAAIVATVVAAGFGWVQERAVWRPLRRRGTGLIAMMIVSIGFALFLRFFFQFSFGGQRRTLSEYTTQARNQYGPISIADKEIVIIGVALVVIVATLVLLMTTRLGKSMRAVSDNPALAASSGMRVDGVAASAWIIGTALSSLAGALLAVNSQVDFLMGFRLLLLVFAAVTLGGLGTTWGALLGSMVIGFMVELGPLFGVPSSIKEVGALVVLILVLLVRPQGILGRRQRIG